MTTQKKTIRIWPVVFFVLLAMSGTVIAGMCFAKMVNDPIPMDTSMQIAKWDVSVEGSETNNLNMVAGGAAQSYGFTVINDSDVASKYVVTVSNIPSGVKVGLDNGELISAPSGVAVFSDIEEPIAANSSENHTIKIAATLDSVAMTDVEIQIDVVFIEEDLR